MSRALELEPEQVVTRVPPSPFRAVVFIYLLLVLTITGVLKYLPAHVWSVKERSAYYFFGQEAVDPSAVQRLVAGWVGHNLTREL